MTSPAELVRETLAHRARRARLLAGRHEESAQVLGFYAHVAEAQSALLEHADDVVPPAPVSDRGLADDLSRAALGANATRFLAALTRRAPAPLASSLGALASSGAATWREALDAAMSPAGSDPDPADPASAFFAEALVQPFAEVVARHWAGSPTARPRTTAHSAEQRCPCCGDRPVVGLLREQGHGAGRLLVCGRCATEWPAPRMVCPSCAAIDVQALPVSRSDVWPAIRIESCEHCRHYLKSIDLTVDGAAVAIVDDLASLPLDLWAAERGLARARANLLRL